MEKGKFDTISLTMATVTYHRHRREHVHIHPNLELCFYQANVGEMAKLGF